MSRNKKGNKYLLTRAKYKSIKAFDHQQMEQFCMDVYMSGYEDGQESVPGVDVEEIMKVVANTKGIGKTRLDRIREGVELLFRKDDEG